MSKDKKKVAQNRPSAVQHDRQNLTSQKIVNTECSLPQSRLLEDSTKKLIDTGLSTTMDNLYTSVRSNRYASVKKQDVVLHKILKKLIKENRLKVDDLARELDIPRSTFRSLLDDSKTKYDPVTLEKLCTRFNVPLSYLLYGGTKKARVDLKSLPTMEVFSGYAKITIEKIVDEDDLKNGNED